MCNGRDGFHTDLWQARFKLYSFDGAKKFLIRRRDFADEFDEFLIDDNDPARRNFWSHTIDWNTCSDVL